MKLGARAVSRCRTRIGGGRCERIRGNLRVCRSILLNYQGLNLALTEDTIDSVACTTTWCWRDHRERHSDSAQTPKSKNAYTHQLSDVKNAAGLNR